MIRNWAGLSSYDYRRNLEVEVSVLLATSVDVFLSFSHKMGPYPENLQKASNFAQDNKKLPLNPNYLHMTTCCIFPLPGAISQEK